MTTTTVAAAPNTTVTTTAVATVAGQWWIQKGETNEITICASQEELFIYFFQEFIKKNKTSASQGIRSEEMSQYPESS